MYQDHQGLPRQFYKEQCKKGEEGADKRSVGRIISLSGQGFGCFCFVQLRHIEGIVDDLCHETNFMSNHARASSSYRGTERHPVLFKLKALSNSPGKNY